MINGSFPHLPWGRRRGSKYFGLAALIAVAGGVACATTADGTGTSESNVEVATSLDTMDVAILLPIPSDVVVLPGMLSLATPTSGGTPVVSKETFKSILDAQTARDAEGHLVKSGIVMSGTRSPLKTRGLTRGGPFDFGLYESWKITSTRLEPCAVTPTTNHAAKPDLDVTDQFDAAKCRAQLNIVAQPVLGSAVETGPRPETQFAFAADYAVHLIYELTETEARAAARDLLALKNACAASGKTDGEPLGVHPCFQKEMAAAAQNRDVQPMPRHEQLASFIGTYAKKLVNAAFMGTDLGQDPWIFYAGNVTNGVFEPIRVFTVAKDPSSAPIDSHGNRVRLPFDNARYQMLTLVMAGQSDVANPIVPSSADGLDNIVYSYKSEFKRRLRGQTSPEESLNRATTLESVAKLATNIHNLENPRKNDFFSVDCVSCHTSTQHSTELLGPFGAVAAFGTKSAGSRFLPIGGTTTAVHPASRQAGSGTVVNFAYRFNEPSVSRRVAYEASLSAAMINHSFLNADNAGAREASCEQAELEACLEFTNVTNSLSGTAARLSLTSPTTQKSVSGKAAAALTSCQNLVCVEKRSLVRMTATQLTRLVGFRTGLTQSPSSPQGSASSLPIGPPSPAAAGLPIVPSTDAGVPSRDGGSVQGGSDGSSFELPIGTEVFAYMPAVLPTETVDAVIAGIQRPTDFRPFLSANMLSRGTVNIAHFKIDR